MSKVAVVTDSTASIPHNLVKQHNLHVAPQQLIWGNDTYRDGVDIQPDEFYARLKKSATMPTSSQVSPGALQQMFSELFEEGYDSILAVLVSSKLSGTMTSATQAKAMLADKPIELIDSLTTAMGMGYQAIAAGKLAAQGASLAECQAAAEYAKARCHVIVTVDTLEFLHRGGRIGGGARFLGTLLNFKPMLEVQNGKLEALERVRTRSKAIARLVDLVEQRVGGKDKKVRMAALHAYAEAEAQELLALMKTRVNIIEDCIAPVSPVVGVHVGPGTLGAAFIVED